MSAPEKAPSDAGVRQPQAVDEGSVEYLIDPEEEKRVIWKIDRAIMPLMFAIFFFQCQFSVAFQFARKAY
jgi:hypothetical protein